MLKRFLICMLLAGMAILSGCGSHDMTQNEKAIIDKAITQGENSLSEQEKEILSKALADKPQAKSYAEQVSHEHMMRDWTTKSKVVPQGRLQ